MELDGTSLFALCSDVKDLLILITGTRHVLMAGCNLCY